MKNIDTWKQVYNVYTYEIVQLVKQLLIFQDIKIKTPGLRKATASKSFFNMKLKLDLNINLDKINIFKMGKKGSLLKKKRARKPKRTAVIASPTEAKPLLDTDQSHISQERQELEFEGIFKSLVTILEYDRTYPESRKQLLENKKGIQINLIFLL